MGPYDDPVDSGRATQPDPRQKSPGTSESRWKSGLKSAGRSLSSSGSEMMSEARSEGIRPVQYRTGGKVRRTGPAILHRDERVIPASKRGKVERMMKRSGMRLTNKKRRASRS